MNENDVIAANAAVVDQVYKTCESDLSYFTKLVGPGAEGKTKLSVFMPKTGKWKEMEVPNTYKLRGLGATEQEAYAAIAAGKVGKAPKAPRDPNAPKGKGITKEKGVVSGLGMIAAWAKYIGEFVDQVGGRTKVIEAMKADFPQKHDSIEKWANAYLVYFNSGRFAKVGVPRQKISKVWILSEEEKAAGVRTRAPKEMGEPKVRQPKAEDTAPAAV